MRIISGIRPTGNIHLGNYLGAIKEWKKILGGCYFIADLHGRHTEDEIKATYDQLNSLCNSFCLSVESRHKPEILEILHDISFYISAGQLGRMTQFKDKSKTEDATLALFNYPALMAADIFFYGASYMETIIPIGADQVQHIEFVRDIADKMGYIKPVFSIGEYPRIMSLTDATKKMSKSDTSLDSCIFVTDSPSEIRRKTMRAKSSNNVTDDTPEMKNLMQIYRACGGKQDNFMRVKDFKEELAELIIKEIAL